MEPSHIQNGWTVTYMRGQMSSLVYVNSQVSTQASEAYREHSKFRQTTESLRTKLAMEPYTESAAQTFKLSFNDNWLHKCRSLALPALSPTTPEAWKYFFTKIWDFSEAATTDKKRKGKVNFEAFAQEWNRTADGKERFYVTFEVLSVYAKSWEKANNIRSSQELMSGQLRKSRKQQKCFWLTEKLSHVTSPQIHPRSNHLVAWLWLRIRQSHPLYPLSFLTHLHIQHHIPFIPTPTLSILPVVKHIQRRFWLHHQLLKSCKSLVIPYTDFSERR